MNLAEFLKDVDSGLVPQWFIERRLRDAGASSYDRPVITKLRSWPSWSVYVFVILVLTYTNFRESLSSDWNTLFVILMVFSAVISVVLFIAHINRRKFWRNSIWLYYELKQMGCVGGARTLNLEGARKAGEDHLCRLFDGQIRQEIAKSTDIALELIGDAVHYHGAKADSLMVVIRGKIDTMISAGIFLPNKREEVLALCSLRVIDELLEDQTLRSVAAVTIMIREGMKALSGRDQNEILYSLPRLREFVTGSFVCQPEDLLPAE